MNGKLFRGCLQLRNCFARDEQPSLHFSIRVRPVLFQISRLDRGNCLWPQKLLDEDHIIFIRWLHNWAESMCSHPVLGILHQWSNVLQPYIVLWRCLNRLHYRAYLWGMPMFCGDAQIGCYGEQVFWRCPDQLQYRAALGNNEASVAGLLERVAEEPPFTKNIATGD